MRKEEIINKIKLGEIVLEIGPGDFTLANHILEKGGIVTVIEKRLNSGRPHKKIQIIYSDIQDLINSNTFVPINRFDQIILINVLQFLDKTFVLDKLSKWLKMFSKNGAQLYIETFSKKPVPNFDKDIINSVYSKKDLTCFGNIDFYNEGEEEICDAKGIIRKFSYIDCTISLQ